MNITELESLSNAEKIILVEQLWDSIDKETIELNTLHKEELDRRITKHQKGEAKYSKWLDVKLRMSK